LLKKKKLLIGSFVFAGVLKISGDVSENGNINLSLKEVDSPIAILPGTKELGLTKLLDKEVKIDYLFAMFIFVRVHINAYCHFRAFPDRLPFT